MGLWESSPHEDLDEKFTKFANGSSCNPWHPHCCSSAPQQRWALGSRYMADSKTSSAMEPSTAQELVCPPDQMQALEEQLHLT